MPKKSVKCDGNVHKWVISVFGPDFIRNGFLDGTKCICGKKMVVTRLCDCCGKIVGRREIDTNSAEAARWYAG